MIGLKLILFCDITNWDCVVPHEYVFLTEILREKSLYFFFLTSNEHRAVPADLLRSLKKGVWKSFTSHVFEFRVTLLC